MRLDFQKNAIWDSPLSASSPMLQRNVQDNPAITAEVEHLLPARRVTPL
jgi:hypothetical protein